jgi:hypothetical protein
MVKGTAASCTTTGAPKVVAPAPTPAAAPGHDMGAMKADVNATLGEMFVKADTTSVKAGKVTLAVRNTGGSRAGAGLQVSVEREVAVVARSTTDARWGSTRMQAR